MTSEEHNFIRGVSHLWSSVNHVAIVVSDVGRSLHFYTDIIGMKQVMRPNFDRHGAWLTFGNIDLHLIKGLPAVHKDDDLIVSHIAITVSNMTELREKLTKLNVASRKNVSVPNPADSDTGAVDQAFVRDPDGYYIEFCNCEKLEMYLHEKMAEEAKKWDMSTTKSVMNLSKKLKALAMESKTAVKTLAEAENDDYEELDSIKDYVIWPDFCEYNENKLVKADQKKLGNLVKRRKVYGDITQNATKDELEMLLRIFDNHVPQVIGALEDRVRTKGSRTFIPPAFFDRDGNLSQPPAFEMSVNGEKVHANQPGFAATHSDMDSNTMKAI